MEDSTKHKKIYLQVTMSWKRKRKNNVAPCYIAIGRKKNDIAITHMM
jgi:hypothetical protein